MLSTRAEPAECRAGIHVGDRFLQMPPLPPVVTGVSGPWPVLGCGSDKEGWALSGPTERTLGLSGDPELVSSLLRATLPACAVATSPQLQPPEKQSRRRGRQGPCPLRRLAWVSARPAASRPGFKELGGQLGAGSAWAWRPNLGGAESVPRCPVRPKEISATRDRGPWDNLEMSQALSCHEK